MFSDSTSSSRLEVFCKNVVLKNSVIFTGKHLYWSLLLIKFLLKKTPTQVFSYELKNTPTQVFSYEFWGIVKNSFLIEHLRWLLLSFFTRSQKEIIFLINHSVIKTFEGSDVLNAQNVQHSQKKYFSSVDFLVVKIYRYFLIVYVRKKNLYSFYLC